MNKKILVVDDNLTICLMLKSWLSKKDFKVETASNVEDAKLMVKDTAFDMILSDIHMPETDGFSFLAWVKKFDSEIIVIMMTSYADIESAVESMKSGAADYIAKPIEPDQLFGKIDEAFRKQSNKDQYREFINAFVKAPGKEYRLLFEQLDTIAENNEHALIMGDRGTGKLSAVRYIYEKGAHISTPFVILDCDQLARKELVYGINGQESPLLKKVDAAKGGLLFIRKINLLNKKYQDELLTFLTRQKKDDFFTQVITSSEQDGEELGRTLIPKLHKIFWQNSVTLPQLNGKKKDIEFFAMHFLKFANLELDKNIQQIAPEIQEKLISHSWPGNIQELKNIIIKAALLTEGVQMPADIVPDLFKNSDDEKKEVLLAPVVHPSGLRKENYEKQKIQEALELAKGNKTMAASILNIDRKTLYNKIKLYKVEWQN